MNKILSTYKSTEMWPNLDEIKEKNRTNRINQQI